MNATDLLKLAMPRVRDLPTKWAVFRYTVTTDRYGDDDREPTEWEFDTFDEAANKAEDLDSLAPGGVYFGVDEIEVTE